jgi:predicted nucleic acid-binding protein
MARVYLETSFVSYLTAAPRESRDPVAAAHQQITIEWWSRRRPDFDLVVSQVVLDEAQEGNPEAIKNRVEALASLPRLQVTEAAIELARTILSKGLLPQKAFPDALHIAIATVHEVEYLLTWNCKHIANVEILPRIASLCEDLGLTLPIICTPEELLGVENGN